MSDQCADAGDDLKGDPGTGDMPADSDAGSADIGKGESSETPLETSDDESSNIVEGTETSDALDDDLETDSSVENSETTSDNAETGEHELADLSSDNTDTAVEDKTDAESDAPLEEEAGNTNESASTQEVSDSTEKADGDKVDTKPETPLEEETGDTNEPASAQEAAGSTEKADGDKVDTKPETPLEEETGDTDEPAATQEVADGTEKADGDKADTEPETPLEEETGDSKEPACAQEVADGTEKADGDKTDTEPETPLEEETGDTDEPASAHEVADSTKKADEDKADTETAPPLKEEAGDTDEAGSTEGGIDSADGTEGAVEDKADAESDAPARDNEEQPDAKSEGVDTKSARDMVPPEEYLQHKKIYDMLDNQDKMPISPEYRRFRADRFRNMDVELKSLWNECGDRIKCNNADYVEYDEKDRPRSAPYFSSLEKGFKFNQEYDLENPLGKGYDYAHESAHNIDWLHEQEGSQGRLSRGLSDTVREDFRDAIEQIKKEKDCDDKAAMNELAFELASQPHTSRTVADVFGGAGLNEVPGFYPEEDAQPGVPYLEGHSKEYWRAVPDRLGREAFAGLFADQDGDDTYAIGCAQKYMPKTWARYQNNMKTRDRL